MPSNIAGWIEAGEYRIRGAVLVGRAVGVRGLAGVFDYIGA